MNGTGWRAVGCGLLGAAMAAAPARGSGAPQFVVVGRDAMILTPPSVVASGEVRQADWSSDGRFVLAVRQSIKLAQVLAHGLDAHEPPPGEVSLVLWDRETEASSVVWKGQFRRLPGDGRFTWVPHTEVAFALVPNPQAPPPGPPMPQAAPQQPPKLLLRIDAKRGSVRVLGGASDRARLVEGAEQPLQGLVEPEENALRLLRADGTVQRLTRLPNGSNPYNIYWTNDGAALLVEAIENRTIDGKDKSTVTFTRVEAATGASRAAEPADKPFQPRAPEVPIHVRRADVKVSQTETVHPLWLDGTPGTPPALAAADAEWGVLAPDGSAPLYEVAGSAWVAPLLRLPAEQFVAAREAAVRQVLISNGKQIALGVLIYANDHDDTLPGAADSVRDLVLGMKDAPAAAIFEGFVYTFTGGKLTDVQEPSNTMMGYIPGPGGRALVYVDGHVRWEADPK